MGFNRGVFNALKNINMISQLALTMVTPCFLTIALCIWLKNKFNRGNWLIVAGILWGIASGICGVYNYMKKAMKDAEKQQREYDSRYK